MPAAAVDKVFEHLHPAHDALARVVGRRQPSLAGSDPIGGDPPDSGKRLTAAILRYDALAACAPAAYHGTGFLAGAVRQAPGGPPQLPGSPRPPCAPGPRRGMGPGPAVLHARRTAALDKANGNAPGPNHVEAGFLKALPAPVQWLLVHSYRAILPGAPPTTHWRDAHFWLSPMVPGSAKLYDYRLSALSQLYMKLLTGPLSQWITEVLTRHGVVSDWQQGALPGSNTGPPLFMAQRQLQRGRPKYIFSFDARKAFYTAPHGALHLILCHLSVPPAVSDILLFVHTAARVRIATAHGLTQPVHMPRGVRQGKSESSPLYALHLEPLIRVQGHRLRPPERPRGPSLRPIWTTCW